MTPIRSDFLPNIFLQRLSYTWASILVSLQSYTQCFHQCKSCGIIYECGRNNCRMPFQYDRCLSCV